MGLRFDLIEKFKDQISFNLSDAYEALSDKKEHSIRARIYEGLGVDFKRIGKGLYTVIGNEDVVVIEGDGRDLSILDDNSIDLICTDFPWFDKKSHKGGDRNFANEYDCFSYTLEDFKSKARVLRDGCFLIEMLPQENANNFHELYRIKCLAEEAGFQYFTKTMWKKGNLPYNTGRNQSNLIDVYVFSKGKARALRPDKKKIKATGEVYYMSGATAIVPSIIQVDPVSKNEMIHQSEKPVSLLIRLLELFSLEGEVCLDSFAGSGSFGEACLKMKRKCVLIEKLGTNVKNIIKRLENTQKEELLC